MIGRVVLSYSDRGSEHLGMESVALPVLYGCRWPFPVKYCHAASSSLHPATSGAEVLRCLPLRCDA
jgi:hypothetical protein